MKAIFQVTVNIVIDTNDDMTIITAPAKSPLDDLEERLRREMIFGRDAGSDRRPASVPGATVGLASACQSCPERN